MSDTLFAMPSWYSGAARTLDMGGVFDDYNFSRTPGEADAVALALDWYATGNAIRMAALQYEKEASGQGVLPLENA